MLSAFIFFLAPSRISLRLSGPGVARVELWRVPASGHKQNPPGKALSLSSARPQGVTGPECARPRAQPQASFQPQYRFQQLTHPTLLQPGQPHSAYAEI